MPDLDALRLLAEKVMGWEVNHHGEGDQMWLDLYLAGKWLGRYAGSADTLHLGRRRWDPFTSPADAVELAEAMRKRGWWVNIESPGLDDGRWMVSVGWPHTSRWPRRTYLHTATFSCAVASAILAAVRAEMEAAK